eukprot:3748605-Amphidinium_carterae.1
MAKYIGFIVDSHTSHTHEKCILNMAAARVGYLSLWSLCSITTSLVSSTGHMGPTCGAAAKGLGNVQVPPRSTDLPCEKRVFKNSFGHSRAGIET